MSKHKQQNLKKKKMINVKTKVNKLFCCSSFFVLTDVLFTWAERVLRVFI